jgi:cell division protein FtsB
MAAIKQKKYGRWIFLSALIILLSAGAAGNLSLIRVRRETRRLQDQILELNSLIDSLSDEIGKLRTDTAYIERLAREKLGMARIDERVYKFVGEKK